MVGVVPMALAATGRFDQFLAWREEKLARQRNQYGAQERRRERLQTTIGGVCAPPLLTTKAMLRTPD